MEKNNGCFWEYNMYDKLCFECECLNGKKVENAKKMIMEN